MNRDKIVALVAALVAAVLPVLVNDHVITGVAADLIGAVVGTFVVGYHVPSVAGSKSEKAKEPEPTPTP